MKNQKPQTKYLKDYTPPAYLIETVDLTFNLEEEYCKVNSRLFCRLNPRLGIKNLPFVGLGKDLELKSIHLDGKALHPQDYVLDEESLVIGNVPDEFILEVETRTQPQKNTSLEGLYKSSGMFCTQCEPEGFRKITYFPDRPDVMSRYSTRIVADRDQYPVLLSNGNPIENGELKGNRHWAKWEDPFRKPSYLFALVAGNLLSVEDRFTTRSGRLVKLQIFVEEENIDKCDHAMLCLKLAMKWDEDVFSREYDLDIFMIVAVNDFNAGAMENKGLNIFNSSYVLALPETATDSDFERIQTVVAHEYFHNWTGNRITCRDWFQLSLKEGLTIFRDQQFSADMISATVKRIQEVKLLRTAQFAEDSSPMAHQVRPDSYMEINNFYTVTVYNKGAELIRMMYILLGKDGFHLGMELYFERHDGQAATTEDFVKAMEDANSADLKQFRLWYTQAGTPVVTVETEYDADDQSFLLTLKQTCSATPGQEKKKPFHIPIDIGLLDQKGKELPLFPNRGSVSSDGKCMVLNLRREMENIRFANVPRQPFLSILRGFSAPVRLERRIDEDELMFLISHDSDEFNRWDSAQQLTTLVILRLVNSLRQERFSDQKLRKMLLKKAAGLIEAFKKLLTNDSLDKDFIAHAIALPSEMFLAEEMEIVDVESIHRTREMLKKLLAELLQEVFLNTYSACSVVGEYRHDTWSVGRRRLKNLALEYLISLDDGKGLNLCLQQYRQADNMTDEKNALACLANKDFPQRLEVLDTFFQKWRNNPLVMNTWFSVQAASKLTNLYEIKKLANHPAFDPANPNKLRALFGTYYNMNPINFHVTDGSGYEFLAEQVLDLDKANPQIAARLLTPLTRWRKFDPNRQTLMKSQLERILDSDELSGDVYEIAMKSLD